MMAVDRPSKIALHLSIFIINPKFYREKPIPVVETAIKILR